MEAQLRDISLGGFGLFMDSPLAAETEFRISFDLPGGYGLSNLAAAVCNVRPTNDSTFVGCRFASLSEEQTFDLEYFVTSSLDHMHHQSSANGQLLIISDDLEFISTIRTPLGANGAITASVVRVMDGFYRMRLRTPDLVVVKQRLPNLSGTEICRIIRTPRGCEAVPVIIYGDDNAKTRPMRGPQISTRL